MNISLIVAISDDGFIGKDNTIPWDFLPADMKHFMQTTKDSAIVMVYNTWLSLPEDKRPLKNRYHLVISRKGDLEIPGVTVVNSFSVAVQKAERAGHTNLYVIGGNPIYKIGLDFADTLYITRVHTMVSVGDVRFPDWDPSLWVQESEKHHPADERNSIAMTFETYRRSQARILQ